MIHWGSVVFQPCFIFGGWARYFTFLMVNFSVVLYHLPLTISHPPLGTMGDQMACQQSHIETGVVFRIVLWMCRRDASFGIKYFFWCPLCLVSWVVFLVSISSLGVFLFHQTPSHVYSTGESHAPPTTHTGVPQVVVPSNGPKDFLLYTHTDDFRFLRFRAAVLHKLFPSIPEIRPGGWNQRIPKAVPVLVLVLARFFVFVSTCMKHCSLSFCVSPPSLCNVFIYVWCDGFCDIIYIIYYLVAGKIYMPTNQVKK